jgi:hypothetical protein
MAKTESAKLFVELRRYWRGKLGVQVFNLFTKEIANLSADELFASQWATEEFWTSLETQS